MLTAKEARRLFLYNKKTGSLIWKIRPSNAIQSGTIAGSLHSNGTKNYLKVCVNGRRIKAHRVIWLFVTGAWPEHEVDHENGDGTDNRWKNLRQATHLENGKNQRQRSDNTSGHTGVTWNRKNKCWIAQITHNKKNIYLGSFKKKKKALDARKEAEVERGFHKNHGSKRPL